MAHTGINRALSSSYYNKRRQEVALAIQELRRFRAFSSLFTEISQDYIDENRHRLSNISFKRLYHALGENKRVISAASALENGKIQKLGSLLLESHRSLRDYYEVSCRELDLMVDCAQKIEGSIGARMTGAGFGGCVLILVDKDHIWDYPDQLRAMYRKKSGIEPTVYLLDSSAGPKVIPLS
jgi:galactokinase